MLYSSEKELDQLRKLLEGKTIQKIDPATLDESICKFILTDGTAFILCATELGFWIKETAGITGYKSLDALMSDYGDHIYNADSKNKAFTEENAKIDIINNIIIFTSPFNKEFHIALSNLSKNEQKLINHKTGKKLLERMASSGYFWRGFMHHSKIFKKLPKDLKEMFEDHNA